MKKGRLVQTLILLGSLLGVLGIAVLAFLIAYA